MDILRLAVAFIIVFGLLGGLYFLSNRAKKMSSLPGLERFLPVFRTRIRGELPFPPEDDVRHLKRVHLTANHQLHFISVNSRKLLLCTHPQGCTVLQNSQEEQAAEGNHAG